jgi:hypothetical protein
MNEARFDFYLDPTFQNIKCRTGKAQGGKHTSLST